MKLLSSPSTSSSSSSTSMCISTNATVSCFSGILRRILCSYTLPTHPSDDITHASSLPPNFKSNDPTNPGIVARLMGLDSFPHSSSTTQSFIPSEYKAENYKKQSSFLEMPAFLELENEDFLLLSFEKRSKREQLRKKKRREKSKIQNSQLMHKDINKMVSGVVHEEHITNRISEGASLQDTRGAKLRRKKKKIEEAEDCISDNSSPVSVLEFDQFLVDLQVPKSEECMIRGRKLSATPRLENYNPAWRYIDDNSVGDEHRSNKIKESRNKFCHTRHHSDTCRLANAQVMQSSWKFHDLEDICAYFGLGILDHLLEELMHLLFC